MTVRAQPARRRGGILLATAALIAATAPVARATPTPSTVGAPAAPLTGFLSQPTEQLGVPGSVASGEITPDGDVYTGWAEYEPFIGARLHPLNQSTWIAPDPSVPRYEAARRDGSVRYVAQTITVDVGSTPVVYLTLRAVNLTTRTQTARVALAVADSRGPQIVDFRGVTTGAFRYQRPAGDTVGDGQFFQLGEPFSAAWQYAQQGRDTVRDGELLVRGPATATTAVTTPAGDTPTTLHDERALTARLASGGQASWTWQIPLEPPAAGAAADAALDAVPLTTAARRFAALWRGQEAGMMQVQLPERRITDVYRASVATILDARIDTGQGWLQAVNRLQYQAYWLRDSAIITVALDQIGLHRQATQNLGYLPYWQQPDGLYISRAGEQDGIGQALWELAQHAQLTDSPAFAASQIPNVTAAVEWIDQASVSQADGLLPPSTIADDEYVSNGQITGDNLWAAVGLRSAITLAQLAGRPDLVSAWQALDRRFEASLDAAIASDLAQYGHVTPALDQAGGFDWGNYNLAYPQPILPADSPAVTATIAWEQAHSTQGLADYMRLGYLHDYLGFPIFQTELERGGSNVAQAIAGLYAETIHTTASGGGWESGPIGYAIRDSVDNLAPHGTFAAQYISLLHNLLVDDSGSAIDLLGGVSPAWMGPSQSVVVSDAVTSAGTVDLHLRATAHGATLRWSLHRYPGTTEPLEWVLPYWVSAARTGSGATVRGRVRLAGDSGQLTLRWSAPTPSQSLARAIGALDESYAARHRAAPLTTVSDW